MDGPSVNWKKVKIKEYWEHNDPDGSDLIEIDICRLHVLHSAYGTVQKAIDWNLGKLFKAITFNFQTFTSTKGRIIKVNELLKSHE